MPPAAWISVSPSLPGAGTCTLPWSLKLLATSGWLSQDCERVRTQEDGDCPLPVLFLHDFLTPVERRVSISFRFLPLPTATHPPHSNKEQTMHTDRRIWEGSGMNTTCWTHQNPLAQMPNSFVSRSLFPSLAGLPWYTA